MQPQPKDSSPAAQVQRHLKRLGDLRTARSSWDSHWRDLASNIAPRRSRFFAAEVATAGERKEQQIINSTPVFALRTLSAGMMAGITSPAREWFRLTTVEPGTGEDEEVKEWLHTVTLRILDAMHRSNFYNMIQQLFEDLALFGTAVVILESDEVDAIRAYCVPVGEYFLAQSHRGQIDTMYRTTEFTVEQLVDKFGYDAVSTRVRSLFDAGNLDTFVEVVHVIHPRRQFDPSKADPKNKPWASCWFEADGGAGNGYLLESGYEESPLLAPRWGVTGNDVYGYSPAMQVLGDCRALQLYEEHSARATELMVDPPLNLPQQAQGLAWSLLPSARNYVPTTAGAEAKAALEVQPAAVSVVDNKIGRHEQRINRGLYADLWLMLSQEQAGSPITAREVAERHEEKMLQLGPVMERLNPELLRPAIERIFGIEYRAGRLPPPPPALQGQPLRVVFLSIMAQAQKAISAASIQQLITFMLTVAAQKPEVLDKANTDEMSSQMSDALGAPPNLLLADDQVKKIRDARAKAQQAAAAQQAAMVAAKGAKDLASADTSGQNALTQLVGPVAAAQGGNQ